MKIDRRKIVNRCGYDQNECMLLAKRLAACPDDTLISELKQISVWNYGKCELGLWVDVLDRLDAILEHAVTKVGRWMLRLDLPENASLVDDVVTILEFTGHLIEHSIYRYLYGSWNHILALFGSENMDILLAVLGLAYNFR
ncbi:E3 ubiquitin-protein ligase HUWE1 [Clonorchis sinensis]|uniref:E3 ubiquitin-protein ligase HUWE1 n=1 Tax=Clonorchis sinensis TaxID=79923 RepID=G7YQ91_CLOSI|nr:E3 ubiquitin-protein ligase HUWE1 [Clonorchis sinensis]